MGSAARRAMVSYNMWGIVSISVLRIVQYAVHKT
jgi:hypothetical protein